MAYNEHLAAALRMVLAKHSGLSEKKMAGGIGFMLHASRQHVLRDSAI